MPRWKVESYTFFFKVICLTKNKPAHIYVITEKGKIQFWLEKTDTKSQDEIKIKKVSGNVSDNEKNKIGRIVKEKENFFLKEWEKEKNKRE